MATAKVKIAARLRPRIPGEIDDGAVQVCHVSDETGASSSSSSNTTSTYISVANPRDPTTLFKFPFTSCYDEASTQEEIFQNDVGPLIDVVYNGVTVTIFAYGVTSSGKTYTMQGTKSDPGVIPRVVRAMFEKKSQYNNYNVSLSISYMEIYKDDVYDLLVTRENAPKLPVRENDVGMVFVANLSSESISSVEEFDIIYNRATKHRSVGATNLNRASSRSHAVLTIEARMMDPVGNKTLTGKINLVDLAGSENNKLTGNDPSRMAESSAINKSLSVLGQVVHALNTGASRIPYRNSKLTRILQDALGGSSVGLLICNLAPGNKFRQDTLNTLNFAVRTKNIENKPVVNERGTASYSNSSPDIGVSKKPPDNLPVPKPHFAAVAIQPPPPKPAPAIVHSITSEGIGSGGMMLAPAGLMRSRHSLLPVFREPRISMAGGYQPFALPGRRRKGFGDKEKIRESDEDRSGSFGIGLTEKEIDERISKAVEAEVARRLQEREKEREREEEQQGSREQREQYEREREQERVTFVRSKSKSPKKEQSLASGGLTPLIQRHRDLDDELKTRLQELERKFERGNKEAQLADVLSPVSKKKTGRAYVALARAHSEKGDLQVALDLYRKAESYVPHNVKLKERIIEIEWAVLNDKAFVPSPKPPRKLRAKKARPTNREPAVDDDAHMDVDQNVQTADRGRAEFGFGNELTNIGCSAKVKRHFDGLVKGEGEIPGTPLKRQKLSAKDFTMEGSDGEEDGWVLPGSTNGKRKPEMTLDL